MQRFFECDNNARFHIGAAFGVRGAPAEPAECGTTASSAKKRFEEIAEPGSAELELNSSAAIAAPLIKPAAGLLALPLRRRLETTGPVPIRTELIVFLPLFRIAQNFVRLVDLLEFFFGGLFVLRHIRVILTRQFSKSAANLVLARRFRHPECLVIISKLYRHLRNLVRLRSSRNSLSHDGHEGRRFISAHPLFALCPLCEVRYARIGEIHYDHWRGRDARGSGDVERLRAKMVGPTAWRHSDRARTFLVLFSHRYLHRFEHCLEFASVALLNLPALISHNGHNGSQRHAE